MGQDNEKVAEINFFKKLFETLLIKNNIL